MATGVLRRLLRKQRRITVVDAAIPDGVRAYAVGDIHGRVDLVERLHKLIMLDAADTGIETRKVIVYLGDYVDRGLQSRELIDYLLDFPLPGFETIYLKGNHEQAFLDFLTSAANGAGWMRYGGDATVYSYGVRVPEGVPPEERMDYIREQLIQRVPRRHVDFLERLDLAWLLGDFLFVHAGIRPDRPLHRQVPEDLLWVRDVFLDSDRDFGKIIVHGHSMSEHPDVRDNRIGIDTGACYSNVLTCLVLEGTTKRFLTTRDASYIPGDPWLPL